MWTLAYPWVLMILFTPLVLRLLLPVHREICPAVRTPFLERMIQLTATSPKSETDNLRPSWPQSLLQWSSFGLLVLAASRPQQIEPSVTKMVPLRDLMVAVDLSGSMETRDFTDASGQRVDRLTAVKDVLSSFLAQRTDDRIGLIFFGSSPFLQCPFTEDHIACQELLREAQVGMCGPKTAFGDAIGLAIQSFQRSSMQEKVLIVLTDGNDTASQVPPEKAAEIAKDNHVTIYCIGVGDPQAAGEEKFDEATLRDVASTTGGAYFHANDRTELKDISQKLDGLQPRKVQSINHRPKREMFYVPLSVMLLLGLCYHGIRLIRTAHWHHIPSTQVTMATAFVLGLLSTAMAGSGELAFHFIRPWWLVAMLPVALISGLIQRRRDVLHNWRQIVSPHLLSHLTLNPSNRSNNLPLILLAAIWALSVISIAGPTWRREATQFASDQSALVICLECTPSMLAEDIQPSRLTRAAQKIHDLMKARVGTRAALIAYAGDAHLVMPLTSDAGAIDYFATALSPDILPTEGNDPEKAIDLAQQILSRSGESGSILLMIDSLSTPPHSSSDPQTIVRSPVHLYGIGKTEAGPIPPNSPPAPPLNVSQLRQAASDLGATLTLISADDSDIRQLVKRVRTQWTTGTATDGAKPWQEAGYWLTPVLLILSISWFRPGWRVSYE